MDKFSNQLTPQLTSQRKAKFVACNLVSKEVGNYQIRTNFEAFEKVCVDVGSTHRNEHDFTCFCVFLAHCILLM